MKTPIGPFHIELACERRVAGKVTSSYSVCNSSRQEIARTCGDVLAEDTRELAALFAAAPEMLAALQAVAEAYQQHFAIMPVAWQTYDNIVQSAIAKAHELTA